MTEKQEQIKESISLIKGFIFELYNTRESWECKKVIENLSYALYLLENEQETEKAGDF
jgi:hypothetical protein